MRADKGTGVALDTVFRYPAGHEGSNATLFAESLDSGFVEFLVRSDKVHGYFDYVWGGRGIVERRRKNTVELLYNCNQETSLNQDIVKNISVVLPSMDEQKKLVDYISCENRRIQTLVKIANEQISLLQERKQIIINDVVTGKVKVV